MKGIFTKICNVALLVVAGLMLLPTVGAKEEVKGELWDDTTYLGREYNGEYDRLYEDFKRDSVEIAPLEGLITNISISGDVSFDLDAPYYKAVYSATESNNDDLALIKAAGQHNADAISFPYLVIDMRGTSGATISDLVIAFRRDDTYALLEVPFTEVIDNYGENFLDFDGTWQTFVISIADTLEGKQYLTKDGVGQAVDADRMVGFHVYAKTTTGSGNVDIKDPYYSKVADVTEAVVGSSDFPLVQAYWGGSTGPKVEKWLIMEDEASYLSYGPEAANFDGLYESFVLRVRGTLSSENVSIRPYYADNTKGDPVLLKDALGPDEILVPELSEEFSNLVIGFAANSWAKEAVGFELTTTGTGDLEVAMIFLTSLGIEQPAGSYPVINENSLLMFDNFDREVVGTTSAYDTANPVALQYGFTYLIDYSNSNGNSILEGQLKMTQGTGAYSQYVARSDLRFNNSTHRYLLIKYQLVDGATLDNFRFSLKNSSDVDSTVVYANQLFAAQGLTSVPEDLENYKYKSGDYTYLIVDLALSGFPSDVYGVTLYYSGSGAILIDSLAFANSYTLSPYQEDIFLIDDYEREDFATAPESLHWASAEANPEGVTIASGALRVDSAAYTQWAYGIKAKGYRYLVFDAKAENAESTFANLRFTTSSDEAIWWKDSKIVDPLGQKLSDVTTSWKTYTVDLLASGFQMSDMIRWSLDGGAILVFDNVKFVKEYAYLYETEYLVDDYEREVLTDSPDTIYWSSFEGTAQNGSLVDGAMKLDGSEFIQYAVGFPKAGYRYLTIRMKGEEGSSLESFRFGFGTEVIHWWKDGALLGADLNPIADITTEFQDFTIDLFAMGLVGQDTIRFATSDGNTIYVDQISVTNTIETSIAGLDFMSNYPLTGVLGKGVDTIYVGETWVDGGLSSTEWTCVATGSVDNTTAGTYVITYEVLDEEENVIITFKRFVTVLAK